MKTKSLVTIAGIALIGIVIYNVMNKDKEKENSNFSSACGCGG